MRSVEYDFVHALASLKFDRCSYTVVEMATQVSLFLPYGYRYDLKFYERDAARNRIFQDQAQVDLIQSPE